MLLLLSLLLLLLSLLLVLLLSLLLLLLLLLLCVRRGRRRRGPETLPITQRASDDISHIMTIDNDNADTIMILLIMMTINVDTPCGGEVLHVMLSMSRTKRPM